MKCISLFAGSSLSLSALRLLVPPIRLVSAAIWQTVEQKVVSDYGLLEEFVFMVTEIVPQLLSTRQRAELILGLRARLILELCRSDDTADIHVIQPHLDRMQNLRSLWRFMDFFFFFFFAFQDVFPGDFGPTYDKAIQTLMWLFLSRLEKLLPTQTLHSLSLSSPYRIFPNMCVVHLNMSYFYQTFLMNFFFSESYIVDSGILSALCLPPVERVVIVNEQTGTDTESGLVYTVCTEMETQWFGLDSDVKAEMDTVMVTDPTDGADVSESEMADDHQDDQSETLIIGEDGQVTVLDGVEKKPKRRGRKKKITVDEDYEVESGARGRTEDAGIDVLWERPVRKNRGLKMKRSDLDNRTCKVCGKVVSQAKFLQRHMNQHSGELPHCCPVCKRFYKSLRYLQQHKCTKGGRKSKEQETAANMGEQSSSGVTTSAEQLSDKGPFYCPHCSVEFKCKQTFRFHLRNICYTEQQVDPERPEDVKHCFRCDECDKAFKYKSTLDSHKQTHNPLYCEVCMKLVRDSEALAIHEWKHTGYQPFQCPHCSKRFRSYSDLVEHQKKHTKAYPFLCWECGKKFRHGVTLTRHVERVHHSGEPVTEKPTPTFTCAQCGKTFTSRRCLLKHDNFHHKGLRFPCEHCGKGFFGKDALVRHTLIHTGERPFKCDDCEKSFRSAAELKIHRRYHTGERPFKCNICEKGFVQSCFLTLHMRTHTGERPYVCTVCSKGFSSLHGLKRHRRLVHA
uniref:C2H2-type domain-containing protein n=1 Tax=Amphiprion ocellaris TaxID=80972 RepID=A0AAQ5ZJK9_AMPOC